MILDLKETISGTRTSKLLDNYGSIRSMEVPEIDQRDGIARTLDLGQVRTVGDWSDIV
jgi:DNA-directed RNA polymerase subunit H (RpoH/RPB5)